MKHLFTLWGLLIFQTIACAQQNAGFETQNEIITTSENNVLTQENELDFDPPSPPKKRKGMRVDVYGDSSMVFKVSVLGQMWTRYAWDNPGTLGVDGEPLENQFDIGIRRARIVLYGKIKERFSTFIQFGINNQTFAGGGAFAPSGLADNINSGNKKPGLFFHDITTEYDVIPRHLEVGIGLHVWNGLSRLSNTSISKFMTLDLPVFNYPTIELTDQFARQFGVYAKGKVGKLDYRMIVSKPFVFDAGTKPLGRAVDIANNNLAYKGFYQIELFDRDVNWNSGIPMTYLGSKRMFNIGAGFIYQQGFSASSNVDGSINTHDFTGLAADVFVETPYPNGSVFTLYSVFYNYDLGPNYLRSIGIMNIGTSVEQSAIPRPQGGGIAQFTIGTGQIFRTQVGYILPDKMRVMGKNRLQPFLALTYKDFEGLDDTSLQYDLGLNYIIDGHRAKLTLQYSTRPIYEGTVGPDAIGENVEYKGLMILQTQLLF